jgi:acetyl-CoA C-acetyltransferase
MAAASREALTCAGIDVDDVDHLDLYSCFASSVHLACDALGLDPHDQRGLTVTGGLPFSGGAGSNYMLHSIATMLDVLRADPGSTGMVTGVGMHMTKHVFGLYSTAPPPQGRVRPPDQAAVQAKLDATPPTAIVDRHSGPGTVASYTVAHARGGEPEWGLVIADVGDRARAYGRVEAPDLLAAMEAEEWVGREIHLEARGDGVNLTRC